MHSDETPRPMAKAVRPALARHGTAKGIMTNFVIAMIVVVAIFASGLVTLLRNRHTPLPPQDVLDRVAQRNRDLDAQERRERED